MNYEKGNPRAAVSGNPGPLASDLSGVLTVRFRSSVFSYFTLQESGSATATGVGRIAGACRFFLKSFIRGRST